MHILAGVKCMRTKVAVCSDVGKHRGVNQDNFFINGFVNENHRTRIIRSFFASKKEQVICVCDGMGGEMHGEIASLIAVKKMRSYSDKHGRFIDDFEQHAKTYIDRANKAICDYIDTHDRETMGSTLALLCISIKNRFAMAANVGDSKIFLFRAGILTKLSIDHNEAQRLVDLEIISEEEARTHKDKSKLTQHLGIPPEEMIIEPSISDSVLLNKGDMFLICSDGLTDMLNYAEITNVLSQRSSVKARCKALVDKANSNGGVDNITVVICEVV